jgi:hypothetical protein
MAKHASPPPLRGVARALALIWVVGVVLSYIAIRQQFGEGFFP